MERVSCEAIVLGVTDYGEADRLVTIFTRERGKMRGIARGAKKSVRRFAGALELFARLRLELRLQTGLPSLDTADIETVFPAIRRDLMKIALASYACELVERLAAEEMPAPRLFRLLSAYLDRLDSAPAALSDRRFFEVNLLNILGYRPPLEECVGCGTELSGEISLFAGRDGGILCGSCCRGGRPLASQTLILLKQALLTGRFGIVTFPPDLLAEAGSVLDPLIASHMHHPLKSISFLREVAGQQSC